MSDPVDEPTAAPEELVDDLESAAARIRDTARRQVGVTGEEKAEPVRKVLREEGASLYPLVAISSLGLANYFQGYAFFALAPDISRTLGLGIGTIAAIGALDTIAQVVAPFPMAWLTHGKARRALLAISTGIVWSLLTFYLGLVTGAAASGLRSARGRTDFGERAGTSPAAHHG